MKKSIISLCLIIYALIVSAQDSSIIVFQNANVIDGISDKPILNIAIVIDHGKITDIRKGKIKIPSNAVIIDLKGKWLLPGYIDAHVHLGDFERAQRALRSGATTVRTGGSRNFFGITMREAHRHGRADLPDVLDAGNQVRPDMFDLDSSLVKKFPELANIKSPLSGTDNVRRVVKALASKGVDHIKVIATERAGIVDTDPGKQTFTDEELIAIVDEANKAGLKVMAHASTDEGAYAAVKAGVRSIEHGTFLSDKTLALMKSKGTYYVPTFSFWDETPANPNNINPILEKRRRIDVTKKAYKMGIRIVCGTDTRYSEPGHTIADEALYLQKAGMPEMEIIKAMTSTAAQCLGIQDRTGSIKKGMEADIVILKQDPLKDLNALHDILMVVNNGQIRKTYLDSIYWMQVKTDSGVIHAAVATPKGSGPFPTVIILHGTHGFAQEYLNITRHLADSGIIGVAACWFAGRKGEGLSFITPIDFADAPPLVDEPDRFRFSRKSIDSLIAKLITLPKIQKGALVLMGHARGAGACLDYVHTHPGKVQALILNSCGYSPEVIKRANEINVPVLMLHGTVNPPFDGSPYHDIELARQFEDALKKTNKDVEVKYYEGSDINGLFSNAAQFTDTVEQILLFLRKYFRN